VVPGSGAESPPWAEVPEVGEDAGIPPPWLQKIEARPSELQEAPSSWEGDFPPARFEPGAEVDSLPTGEHEITATPAVAAGPGTPSQEPATPSQEPVDTAEDATASSSDFKSAETTLNKAQDDLAHLPVATAAPVPPSAVPAAALVPAVPPAVAATPPAVAATPPAVVAATPPAVVAATPPAETVPVTPAAATAPTVANANTAEVTVPEADVATVKAAQVDEAAQNAAIAHNIATADKALKKVKYADAATSPVVATLRRAQSQLPEARASARYHRRSAERLRRAVARQTDVVRQLQAKLDLQQQDAAESREVYQRTKAVLGTTLERKQRSRGVPEVASALAAAQQAMRTKVHSVQQSVARMARARAAQEQRAASDIVAAAKKRAASIEAHAEREDAMATKATALKQTNVALLKHIRSVARNTLRDLQKVAGSQSKA